MPQRNRAGAFALSVLGLLCALAGTPGSATARPAHLHRIVAGVVRFSSDGSRYVAWQTARNGPVTALDTKTGRRWTAGSAGCALEEASGEGLTAGGGRFLVLCGATTELLNVINGRTSPMPTQTQWRAVGERYAEGPGGDTCRRTSREIRRRRSCRELYDIATGSVSSRPWSAAPDLDRAGAPPVCSAIRSKFEDRILYSDGLLVLPIGGRARLIRCHGVTRTLALPPRAENLQAAGGVISWDTGVDATELSEPWEGLKGNLTAYAVRSGRRCEFALPRIRVPGVRAQVEEEATPAKAGTYGYATHTMSMVFWDATRTAYPGETGVTVATSDVYAARL